MLEPSEEKNQEENISGNDVVNTSNEGSLPEEKQKSKKHRWKGKKHKWRPYYKLSWKEKGELADRQGRRAARIRAKRFAHGQPVAPYNTTQFLMEDQNVKEPDIEQISTGHRHHRESTSLESADEFYSSPEDEEEFLQKEFSEVYERINAERLNSMNKSELIQECIQLEDRVDKLQKKLSDEQRLELENEAKAKSRMESLEKIRIFDEEIKKLKKTNHELREENKKLGKKEEN